MLGSQKQKKQKKEKSVFVFYCFLFFILLVQMWPLMGVVYLQIYVLAVLKKDSSKYSIHKNKKQSADVSFQGGLCFSLVQ